MRSSEEMALTLFQAWLRYEGSDYCNPDEVEWDDLGEFQQLGYLDQVNVIFKYLFEHGRISQYINAQQLEEAKKEYRAYLESGRDA